MTKFVHNANTYLPVADEQLVTTDKLPGGTYSVQYDGMNERFYLKTENGFTHGKLYGEIDIVANRMLNTFDKRPASTGILLAGVAGSGKTLQAKVICIRAVEAGIPVLLVTQPYTGQKFMDFLNAIEQQCVIFFDEYEKMYTDDKDLEDALLSVFDGVGSGQKMFLLTSNDRWGVSKYMVNRPGRIFYTREYAKLDLAFVREYVADNLKSTNPAYATAIVRIADMAPTFNFDMLKALIEEMNRYDESPTDSLRFLNFDFKNGGELGYDIHCTIEGKEPAVYNGKGSAHALNPIKEWTFHYALRDKSVKLPDDDDIFSGLPDSDKLKSIQLTPGDIAETDDGKVVYVKGKMRVECTRKTYKTWDYNDVAF